MRFLHSVFASIPPHAGDVTAGIITGASLLGILPAISALLSIAWVSWRFYQEPQIKPSIDALLVKLRLRKPNE